MNADGGTRSMLEAVESLDPGEIQPVTATFTHASLGVFHRDHQVYEWTDTQAIPIGQAATGAEDGPWVPSST
jgi:hypothetical protein